MLPDRVHNGDMTQVWPVFRRNLPFLKPFLAQTALRIAAKVVKFRRENGAVLRLVRFGFLIR
jgi:hypothetical protein